MPFATILALSQSQGVITPTGFETGENDVQKSRQVHGGIPQGGADWNLILDVSSATATMGLWPLRSTIRSAFPKKLLRTDDDDDDDDDGAHDLAFLLQ